MLAITFRWTEVRGEWGELGCETFDAQNRDLPATFFCRLVCCSCCFDVGTFFPSDYSPNRRRADFEKELNSRQLLNLERQRRERHFPFHFAGDGKKRMKEEEAEDAIYRLSHLKCSISYVLKY